MSEKIYPVKRNEILELDILKTAFGGKGVARINEYVIFVKNAVEGDRVRAKIRKRKKAYAEASILEIIKKSDLRIEPPCPYFNWCGGCTWQNVSYENQLKFKFQHVEENIKHLAGLNDVLVRPVQASGDIWAYRNKMEFSFSDRRWLLPEELGVDEISNTFALGLHVPGTFDKILQIDACLLQNETANQILKFISDYVQENEIIPYGIKSHEGFLRFLVLRTSAYTNEIMVNIVTAYRDNKKLKPLAEQIVKKFERVSSVVNVINDKKAQIAFGEKEYLLAGKSYITDKIHGMEFDISANSFFQTNTRQAEKLYEITLNYANPQKESIVWDLYCGTGTISLLLAQKSKQVTGFELVESAVQDGFKNAAKHGINNVNFIAGDIMKMITEQTSVPDIIVIDPPRAGMHPKVVETLLAVKANKIVYVSCNPSTLARDLKELKTVYRVIEIQSVDMFPHTYHIESVALLEKAS